MLSAKRDSKAAARFFRKVLKGQHIQSPRVITVDKNAAYPVAVEALKEETIDQATELRQSKYLNNIIEQDHRNIKRIVKPMMGLKTFNSARRTLSEIEAMNMMRKGQVKRIDQGDLSSRIYRSTLWSCCLRECKRYRLFVLNKFLRHNRRTFQHITRFSAEPESTIDIRHFWKRKIRCLVDSPLQNTPLFRERNWGK
jgi:hypothetical protein